MNNNDPQYSWSKWMFLFTILLSSVFSLGYASNTFHTDQYVVITSHVSPKFNDSKVISLAKATHLFHKGLEKCDHPFVNHIQFNRIGDQLITTSFTETDTKFSRRASLRISCHIKVIPTSGTEEPDGSHSNA